MSAITGESHEATGTAEAGEQLLRLSDNINAHWKDTGRMQHNRLDREAQAGHAEDNPALARVVGRNIRTLIRLRLQAARTQGVQDRLADVITAFSGRMVCVYLHIVWFGVWVLLNTGHVGMRPFDPFPYGLLTMVVSLEAIFLSTFVLISQNRLGEAAEHRASLDLHIGLLTEHELTRVLHMLHAIHDKLGIDNPQQDDGLADLEKETKPEDVLEEIERLQERTLSSTEPTA